MRRIERKGKEEGVVFVLFDETIRLFGEGEGKIAGIVHNVSSFDDGR